MGKKKFLLILVTVMLVTAFVTGCTTPADTTEPTEAATTGGEQLSFYFLLKTLSNPHWVAMKQGIEAAAAEAGVEVYVDAMNSEDELSGQLDKLLTAAGQGYDGIGIAPISPTNAIEGVVAANEAGIPVVDLDEKIDADELAAAGGYIVGFATTDNVQVGGTGAAYIIENTEPGQVAIIEGKAGNASGEDRKQGAEEAFLAAGYEIVSSQPADWDRNKALDVATNIISQYPDLKAFYCANDTMALGVQEAVENAGLADQIMVVGTDGIPDAFTSVAEGRMAATVAQDPAQIGVVCFNMLLEAVQAGNAGSLDAEPAFQFVDSVLISPDNVGEYLTDEAAVEETDAEPLSFYFLLKTLSNPHWVAMKNGIEAAAAEAGVEVYVDAMNSEDELSGQLDKLLTAAGQGYDGIGIAPISPTNAIEGVVAANAAGIPVVDLDEKIDADELAAAGGYIVGFATTDNVQVGGTGAAYIIENTEPGQVAIIEGKAGNASGEDRKQGAEEAFLAAGYEIVSSQPADWDRNKALDVATNIISQYPDLIAFYCANDTMALGVQEAVENAGLADQIMVVGTDGIPDAFTSVAEGRMAATVAQDPAQIGVVCFNMLLEAVRNGNSGSLDAEPAFQFVDSVLISPDNVGEYID